MKKIYIAFFGTLFIFISLGILYISFWAKLGVEIPNNIEMKTAYGQSYSFNNMQPKIRLFEFMYTSCPDVCPVTTTRMAQLKKRLEVENVFGNKVEFITITIDPNQDTSEVLQAYAEKFHTKKDQSWYFLRGNEKDTKALANSLGFLYNDPGSGNVTHTSYAYLLDQKNRFIKEINMGEGFDVEAVYKRIMSEIK